MAASSIAGSWFCGWSCLRVAFTGAARFAVEAFRPFAAAAFFAASFAPGRGETGCFAGPAAALLSAACLPAFALAFAACALSRFAFSSSRIEASAALTTASRFVSGISAAAAKNAWVRILVPRGARADVVAFVAIVSPFVVQAGCGALIPVYKSSIVSSRNVLSHQNPF